MGKHEGYQGKHTKDAVDKPPAEIRHDGEHRAENSLEQREMDRHLNQHTAQIAREE